LKKHSPQLHVEPKRNESMWRVNLLVKCVLYKNILLRLRII